MPVFDYRCATCGRVTEARQGREVNLISCPCGAVAERVPVNRVHIGAGETTRFRLTEYQEAAAEAEYYHGRMENDRGHELPRRPLINMAADQARKRGAKVKPLPKEV